MPNGRYSTFGSKLLVVKQVSRCYVAGVENDSEEVYQWQETK